VPIFTCAAVLAATYFGFYTWHYVTHNYRLVQEEDQLRRDIAELDQEHDQLVAVRDYLESDEYVEDVARRVLGLVRPGETLVIVSSSAPVAPTPTALAEPNSGAEPWWKDLFVQPGPAPTPPAP
jgi:cell division protein FtsB